MGNAASTTSASDAVSKAVSNAIISTVQNCGASASGTQSVDVGGTGNNVSNVNMSQIISLNLECLGNTTTMNTLQANVTNAITQTLDQQSTAVLSSLGMPSAAAQSKIANEVTNNFTQSNVTNCMTSISGAQSVKVGGSGNTVTGITQTQALTSINKCVQTVMSNMTTTMAAANMADQHVTNVSKNPLDFIGGILSGIGGIVALGIGGALLMIIVLVWAFHGGGGGGMVTPMGMASGMMGRRPYGPYGGPYGFSDRSPYGY